MRRTIELIGRLEASSDPDKVYSGIPRDMRPEQTLGKAVTACTVSELQSWQETIRPKVASTAIGLPQVIYSTLKSLVAQGEISGETVFDEAAQKSVIMSLLVRRGLEDCAQGKMTTIAYANSIAREWAALPCVSDVKKPDGTVAKAGYSYYQSDNINRALVSPDELLEALRLDLGFAHQGKSIASDAPKVRPLESAVRPPERPKEREVETELDHNRQWFKDVWDRNKNKAIRLVEAELKGKSRTLRDADRSNRVAGTAAAGGGLLWLTNLLPDNSKLQPYIEMAQDHFGVIALVALAAIVFFGLRIKSHRVDDAINKGR